MANIFKNNADDGTLLCADTIRCWFDFPYYKLWIKDTDREVANGYNGGDYIGGAGDWYLYRLAEAYLLRAEAYYWLNEPNKAAEDITAFANVQVVQNFFVLRS